jgi:PrtD family type I secretion system ABC transporter
LGAYLVLQNQVTAGAMIAASILMGRALSPVTLAVGTWPQLVNARFAYRRLNELLANNPPEAERMPLPPPVGNLAVEQAVVFPPGSQTPALKGVSLQINAGEMVGIVGPSAAGKSTLARAILGVWPIAQGVVRLDGADIASWDRAALGGFIGYLPQDVELFDGTVAENIARMGEVDASAVVEAAQLAGVHELILKLPQGYDTRLGEGGQTLSGGQRQRIGLARALYKMPPLIVLDEPNSNLDQVGEAALAQAVVSLKQANRTVLLITHRLNILSAVDKIVVLNNGVVERVGPQSEILAAYARPVAVPAAPPPKQATGSTTGA